MSEAKEFVEGGDTHDPFDPTDVARATRERTAKVDSAAVEAKHFLEARQGAYRRVFAGNAATQADVQLVVEDLRRFCYGDTSAFDVDDRVHCVKTGRQEVWIRVQDHLRLDLDALFNKYAAGS